MRLPSGPLRSQHHNPSRLTYALLHLLHLPCCHSSGMVYVKQRLWLEHHPFSNLPTSAGGLLHHPKRIPTFLATALLSLASNVLCGFYV